MSLTKNIKAILFDIDDTLCATSYFTKKARFNAVNAMIDMGLKMSPQELFDELMEVINEFTSNYPEHFDKLLLRIPPESREGINKAVLIASAVVAYHDAKHNYLKPSDDVIDILEFLKAFPLVKGIISDGLSIKQAEKLIRLKLYNYFNPQAIFISEQIGISKKSSKIYSCVCKKLNILPEEIIYIGDHPEKDVDTANQIGMITVRIRKGKKKDLNSKTAPCHDIQNFYELKTILKEVYSFND